MQRRRFLGLSLYALLGSGLIRPGGAVHGRSVSPCSDELAPDDTDLVDPHVLKLFLCGDVMTGRGIDQILPESSSPEIYESYLTSAEQYIDVAERVSGPIPRGVNYDYVWGDALPVLRAVDPAMRLVNLETSVTTSDENWPGKGINYRMHPANMEVLKAACIDCCTLANNHVLDWGYAGLAETLESLRGAGILTAGAGTDAAQAMTPAILELAENQRVIVLSMGTASSGISRAWAAGKLEAGVWLIDELSSASVKQVKRRIDTVKRRGDIVIASIHWGGNWGYAVPPEHRDFAHALIDLAGVDLVHGHSSHHPRGMEVYRDKLILYGCGDFINDYEGIGGHENYRGDLRVMYLPELDAGTGKLLMLRMPVFQTHRFRLREASEGDARWLGAELHRESRRLGDVKIEFEADGLRLKR